MKNILLITLTIFIFSACSSQKNLSLTFNKIENKEQIFSLNKAKEINIEQTVAQISNYDVIFVGDHHNNKKTHDFFAQILTKLSTKGYTLHLANEWFYPNDNALLESYTSDSITAEQLKEKKNWAKTIRYDFELSKKLYEIVKNSKGKLYGINIPKPFRKKISLRNFDKMDAQEKKFYNNLDLDVNIHKDLISPYLEHCNKMPKKSDENCLDRMYRVQVTWDTFMARETYKLSKKVLKTKKDKLIVFAGAFHIEHNLGIPLRFSRLSNKPFTSISNYKIPKKQEISIPISSADILYIYK